MTIVQAASALIDDLVASGSFLRNQVSACDYGIIDTSQAACIVVLQPAQSTFELITYGGGTWDSWGIVAECYMKDTGDMEADLARVWHIHDSVKGAVNAGSITNCASRLAYVVGMNRPRNQFVGLGGHEVMPVYISIVVKEDP